jgi:hypothetical protein
VITNCVAMLQSYLQEAVCSISVASDTFCPTKVGQAVDATFKLVEDSTIIDEDVVSFPSLTPHIEFVIPDKFNDVMESKVSLFSVLPTIVLDLKQVLCIRILLLQHFKTQGRVFSNKRSMVGHVPQVNKLANILRCRVSALPLTYLGLPLGAPFKNKAVWNVVVERTQYHTAASMWGGGGGGVLDFKPSPAAIWS